MPLGGFTPIVPKIVPKFTSIETQIVPQRCHGQRQRTGRAVQQDALGRLHADRLEERWVAERQLDELADLRELLAHAADVVVANLSVRESATESVRESARKSARGGVVRELLAHAADVVVANLNTSCESVVSQL
jgi:hypothetical protein